MSDEKALYRAINACRICGNTDLEPVIDLGLQALTGVFPRGSGAAVPAGPLELVRCATRGDETCGLVQLRHSYEPSAMYGSNYGYRSGLNASMVEHLRGKVNSLTAQVSLGADDVVLDIGSNDGTSLSFYSGCKRVGIDPTAAKFRKYYQPGIEVVADFFSADAFFKVTGGTPAKIVTSISMFYDLEQPLEFAREVHRVLADGGLWHFEQSYLPSMLAANSYDTICHEHLEYYALHQIDWMLRRVGFRIVDISLNDINGGSFAVTARKSKDAPQTPEVERMLAAEKALGLATDAPYAAFRERVSRNKVELRALLEKFRSEGKKIFGMGASTKGNVILQYCGIGQDLLECIAEVNEEKFGCATPGTDIPIVSEVEAMARAPYGFLVLPWHFRKNLERRAVDYTSKGGKLVFPLPQIEVVPP